MNLHPVDSRTRRCCGGIGTHTAGCLPRIIVAQLADIGADAERGADELVNVIKAMSDVAPLMATVDIVAARAHLLTAVRLIDRTMQPIAAEVTR